MAFNFDTFGNTPTPKAEGTAPSVSPTSQPKKGFDFNSFGTTAKATPAGEKEPGFVQKAAQVIAQPFFRIPATVAGIGYELGALAGNKEAAQKAEELKNKGVDLGYLGNVRPLGYNKETGNYDAGSGITQSIGNAAEVASNFVGGAGLRQAGKIALEESVPLMSRIIKSTKVAAPEFAKTGGMAAGGKAAAEGGTPEDVAKQTGIGALGGVLGSPLAPLAPILGKSLLSGTGKIIGAATRGAETVAEEGLSGVARGAKGAVSESNEKTLLKIIDDRLNIPGRQRNQLDASGKNPAKVLLDRGLIPEESGGKLSVGEGSKALTAIEDEAHEKSNILNSFFKESGETVSLADYRQRALEQARSWAQNTQDASLDDIERAINAHVDSLEARYGKGAQGGVRGAQGEIRVPLDEFNGIKSGNWRLTRFDLKNVATQVPAFRRAQEYMGHAAQGMIEREGEKLGLPIVNDLNKELGDLYSTISVLERRNNLPTRSGRMGRFINQTIATILGTAAGGPVVGLAGRLSSDILADILSQANQKVRMGIYNSLKAEGKESLFKEAEKKLAQLITERESRLRLPEAKTIPLGTTKPPESKVEVITGSYKNLLERMGIDTSKIEGKVPAIESVSERYVPNSKLPTIQMGTTPKKNPAIPVIQSEKATPPDVYSPESKGKVPMKVLGTGAGIFGGIKGLESLNNAIKGSRSSYTQPEKQGAEKPKNDFSILMDAFRHVESRGEKEPYKTRIYSGKPELRDALGAYQITEGELETYAPLYFGTKISPEQFIDSPELQDAYMQKKLDDFQSKGYSLEEMIRYHRGGQNAGDNSNPGYLKAVLEFMNKAKSPGMGTESTK